MRRPAAPTNEWLTVPNLLSLGRLAATPVLVWLLVAELNVAATILFVVMGVTDYLDGSIARATGTVSKLGIVLDPTSDRVVVMAALVTLMAVGTLPWWLGLPVLVRDVAISIVFLVLARRGFGRPKVKRVGKTATFALLTALPALVLGGWARPLGLTLFVIGGLLYFVAAGRYAQDISAWMAKREAALPN